MFHDSHFHLTNYIQEGLTAAANMPSIYTLLFATTLAALAYALLSWFPYMLTTMGLSAADSGLMFGLMQLVSVPAGMVLIAIGSRPRMLRSGGGRGETGVALGVHGHAHRPRRGFRRRPGRGGRGRTRPSPPACRGPGTGRTGR